MQDVQAVIASPLRRAIQTAAFVFAPELENRQLPIILAPDAQEISSLTCDLGYDADVTKAQAPDLIAKAVPLYNITNLDTTLIDGLWNSKVSFFLQRVFGNCFLTLRIALTERDTSAHPECRSQQSC